MMKPRFRTLLLATGSMGVTVGVVALWLINRFLWLVGLSTVTSDAPNAPKGLIELLAAIAAMPGWALGLLALAVVGLQIWLTYSVLSQLDDNKSALREAASVKANFDVFKVTIEEGLANTNLIIGTMRGEISQLHREVQSRLAFEYSKNRNFVLWMTLAERLRVNAEPLVLQPDQSEPEVGWIEWERLYLLWSLKFNEWTELFDVDPLGSTVKRQFSSIISGHEKHRLLETHKFGMSEMDKYYNFYMRYSALENFYSMALAKSVPDPMSTMSYPALSSQ